MGSEQKSRVDVLSWYSMIIAGTFPKLIGVSQGIIARQTGRGSWLATGFAILAAALLMGAASWAVSRLGSDAATAATQRVGRPLAIPLMLTKGLLQALIFLGGAYVFVGHLQYYFLPETPVILFVITLGLFSLIAANYGFEPIARFSVIAALGCVAITAIMIPGVAWDLNHLNLFPPDEQGWPSLGTATLIGMADLMMPLGLAFSFLHGVRPTQRIVQHSVLALLTAGGLIIIWPLAEIMVLGPALTAQHAVSCMTLARAAALGVHIHRYELIMVLFFLPGTYVLGAMPLYSLTQLTGRILNVGRPRWLLGLNAVLLSSTAYLVLQDRLEADRFFTQIWPFAVLVCAGIILAVTVGMAALPGPRPSQVSAGK